MCGISLLLISFLASSVAHAQVLYGSLTGNVTDPNGAVVNGADVEALNVNTGAVQKTNTEDGIYRFVALSPGTYTITVSSSGFKQFAREKVVVVVNSVARVDAQLAVGAQKETVTVTTEAPLLQTDKADVHTDLSAQQIESLPDAGSQGRNFQSLLRLIPGVGLTAETNSLAGNPQRAINANVNGQSNQTNNTRIDGAQDQYAWLPANVAYVPPADAIETVNVTTNSFDAEQGMAGGAAVNVQIKSGTNQFHGSGHWFHTDQNFRARNYFQTDTTIFPKKNRNNQNQFGGTFGGPILKNKLFFFADYERTTQRGLAGPQTQTLPTSEMAQGDFRNLPGNPIIYDPATGDATGAGKQQVSCDGVLNVICTDRFDAAAAAMVNLLQPKLSDIFPTDNGLNNFVGSGTALFNRDTADFKVNYVPSQKSMIFARYSFSKTFVFDPPLLGDAVGNATGGGQLGDAPGKIQSVGLGATYAFTPSLLLDWNFGFTRQRLGSTFDLGSPRGLDELNIPGTNGAGAPGGDSGLYNGFPGFQIGLNPGQSSQLGFSMGNAQPANPFLFRDNQVVSGANLNWIRGKHALRVGIEWNHAQINHFQPQGGTFQQPRGAFQFNGTVTSDKGGVQPPTWFNSWADFLLGLPSQTGKAIALFNPTALRWSQWAWYARDQWQVTPKLTVTLGVRWELYPFGYSDNGKGLRYFDLNTGNVLIGGYGNIPRDDGIDVGHGQFLPRLGAAYRLTSSTVIRAGYGQSADPNNWRYFRNAYPAVLLITNVPSNAANFIPAASLTGQNGTGLGGGSYTVDTGIKLVPLPDLSTGVIPLPQTISTTTTRNPFRRGYINSFNLMIQQELKGFVLETGYVGARSIRPLVNMNTNVAAPGGGFAGTLINADLTEKGVCSPCNYTGNINALTPFKNNYYDSLQTKVTRRFKQGSTAGFVWTWSKATDYQGNEDLGALKFPYPTFWEKNRAAADFDRTHNIKIYGIFQLPFGKGQPWAQSGVANHLLGGWQVSPVISYLTGLPITVTASGSNLNAINSPQTADLVGKFHITNGKPARTGQACAQGDLSCSYFDPSAFAMPWVCTPADVTAGKCTVLNPEHYGNTNRNQFRGPGYFQVDLSVARNFKLTERFTLQVRADAFSLTNTPHFANPNVGCSGDNLHEGMVPGSAALCTTANNFGRITGTLSPGGFFGPDPGSRSMWLAARLTF